jgi:hypothetical protein
MGQSSDESLNQLEDSVRITLKAVLADSNSVGNQINHFTQIIKSKKTAINAVEPILFEIYGEKNIKTQRPYYVFLVDSYYAILGSLKKKIPGGVFFIIIDSRDGKIIYLNHGK